MHRLWGAAAVAASLALGGAAEAATLIVNARVVDGTGAAARHADVRIDGGRIVEVGRIRRARGDDVIDAKGLVLAPGFIDTHSHHGSGLEDKRDAPEVVSQGVTTIIVGQDGGSNSPLKAWFAKWETAPAAINIASYTGHNTARETVMGKDFKRQARADEVAAMERLVEEDMRAGALGLSSGLEYDPGIYSSREEMIAVARAAARHGGRYISHVRSEDRRLVEAIDELIDIGRQTGMPVQISHFKLAMVQLWGKADEFTARLDRARAEGIKVTADIYPYAYWQSGITVVFPDRNFTDRAAAEFAVASVTTPEGMRITRYDPNAAYNGKTLAEIARLRGTDPAQTLMDLIAEQGEDEATIIATSMDAGDMAKLIAWPHSNICSDGELAGKHPRGAGAFTRVLRQYVREDHVLTLEQAIHKMSGLAAEHMGINDRGLIREGLAADLLLFDPATVTDRATIEEPGALSVGIRTVWVNGQAVWTDGRTTGARPGRVLRRSPPT